MSEGGALMVVMYGGEVVEGEGEDEGDEVRVQAERSAKLSPKKKRRQLTTDDGHSQCSNVDRVGDRNDLASDAAEWIVVRVRYCGGAEEEEGEVERREANRLEDELSNW